MSGLPVMSQRARAIRSAPPSKSPSRLISRADSAPASTVLARSAAAKSSNLRPKLPASLAKLLAGLAQVAPRDERDITGLCLDSRRVGDGDLFIAVPGERHDGRDYIRQALARGAAAVLCESDASGDSAQRKSRADNPARREGDAAGCPVRGDAPVFAIADLQQGVGAIAARFYAHPSAAMRVIGITGTNGKTTCAWLLAQALDALGQRCGVLGTLGAGMVGDLTAAESAESTESAESAESTASAIGITQSTADTVAPAAAWQSALTTADAIGTQRTLAALRAHGAVAACLEASSHGLAQGRVNHIAFEVAVFTNLSQDHLDYHRDMTQYAAAKEKLFHVDGLGAAVINADDPFGRCLLARGLAATSLTYGLRSGDVRPRNLVYGVGVGGESGEANIAFDVDYGGRLERICSPLIGAINVPNVLAAVATLLACGYDLRAIAAALARCRPPPGRMECVRGDYGASAPAVVVDYAHTPDALRRALASLRELCGGELWLVFGCGGERDAAKRPLMGQAAAAGADHILLTDDNPRAENPQRIVAQIIDGMSAGAATVMHDRGRAIAAAIAAAAAEDIVLIAGKGHESTQTIGARTLPLNDREIARSALEARA